MTKDNHQKIYRPPLLKILYSLKEIGLGKVELVHDISSFERWIYGQHIPYNDGDTNNTNKRFDVNQSFKWIFPSSLLYRWCKVSMLASSEIN